MNWHIIPLADTSPSPWKNGGGVTRELDAWPSAQDWLWRMSVAEVAQSGPFSRFESVQRWFVVLSGVGVRLDVGQPPNQRVHSLTPSSEPLSFAGDAPVHCTLIDGPTQDFNLMLRGAHASARMVRVNGESSSSPVTTQIVAAYARGTDARVHFDAETLTLPPNTLAWRQCPPGSQLRVQAAHALWMEISP